MARVIVYSMLGMLLCALATGVSVFFFTISLAPLAILGMLISVGIALFTAAGVPLIGVQGVREAEPLPLLAAIAVTIVAYLSILRLPGAALYLGMAGASIALLALSRPRFTGRFSIAKGLLAGFTMFVIAMFLVLLLSIALGLDFNEAAALVRLGWTAGSSTAGNQTLQTTAIQQIMIVAPIEELWRFSVLSSFLASGAGYPEATWMVNAWFIFLHAPTRLQYGWIGLVVLAIIGVVVVPFWLLGGREHPLTAIVAHATYNTLISSLGPMLLIEVPILLLLVYLLKRRELPGLEVVVKPEELSPQALLRKVVGE
ncbi:MAG: hypothetical protein QXZ31_07045 [Thermofilaceae archaeon]